MMRARIAAVTVAAWFAFCGMVVAQDGRVGLSEDFDSMDGWKVTRPPLASMKSEKGIGVFETHIKNLPAEMNGKPVCSRTFLELFPPGKPEVKYDERNVVGYTVDVSKDVGLIDLDRYHYIVWKCDWQPMGTWMELKLTDAATGRASNHQVQVAHSSGLISQDLKGLGIGGKKNVTLTLSMFQTGTCLKVDYIRFVSELTDEEKAGLIAAPVTLPTENIQFTSYQNLETLYRRGTRPWSSLPASATELACFRDVGTGVPTWRMTATPAHEGIKGGDLPNVWRDDGSSMSTRSRTWYFDRHVWDGKPGREWTAEKAAKVEDYIIAGDKNAKKWIFSRREGEGSKVIYEHPWHEDRPNYRTEAGVFGNRLVAAMIGSNVVVVDVPADGGQPKVKDFPLPPIGAKGVWMNEKMLSYWAPFLSVHRINVDLDTGEITDGVHHTWTHGMTGEDWNIMDYDSSSKVVLSPEGRASAVPGKGIEVYGIYKSTVSTDYGEMVSDSAYGITNGTGGELNRQYVLFDRKDAGTVLRLSTWNVSYVTWDLRAKECASPDYTKLAFGSDMLGDADQYMTVMRIPSPPRKLKLEGNRLTWEAPAPGAEIARYNVYRSTKSGGPYEMVATVTDTNYTDAQKPAGACYVVAAEEHSELESYFTDEVRTAGYQGPVTVHFEAELQKAAKPWREVVDGSAAGLRTLRLTPVREDEKSGTLSVSTDLPEGKYTLWVRARNWWGDRGALGYMPHNIVLGGEIAPMVITGRNWQWIKATVTIPGGKDAGVDLSTADTGVAIDRIVLSSDPAFKPQSIDDRIAAPAAVAGLNVSKSEANAIELSWQPNAEKDLAFYSVYVGDKPDFAPSNETLLCSTHKTSAFDWGIKPGANYYYKVVAVGKQWKESPVAAVEAKTQPLKVFTKEIVAKDAKASDGMAKGEMSGDSYVEYPGAAAGEQSLTFDLDVPADGKYFVWVKYTPTFSERYRYDNFGVVIDDGKMAEYRTREFQPVGQKTPTRWFVDRLADDRGLKAGPHTLKLVFRNGGDLRTSMGQRIARVWVTNDASFVPSGYIAQAWFKTPAPW